MRSRLFVINKFDILLFLILFFVTPLFFYKLGQSSLVSFDEAWYADIGRNILKTGDLLNLYWNGNFYLDHPPAGFWLIAASMLIFGITEFGARFAPAFSGLLSLFFVYLLGKELFNRWVGFISAIALTSSYWFMFRARSGNLDVILTMFFLLTFLLAVYASKNRKFLFPFVISFILLILTKTIVPLTILPALVIVFWGTRQYRLRDLILPLFVLILIIGGWFIEQMDNHDHFIQRYLSIGLPGVQAETSLMDNLKLMKEYLHNGIGKWFWPGIAALALGPFLMQRRFLMLSVFFISFFLPFIFSHKGHIWHLIPLHPFMILAFFGFSFWIIEKFTRQKILAVLAIFAIGFYFSFIQIRRMWYEFIDVSAFVSDEAILSKEAGKFPQKFYMDGDFGPTAVFYSEKKVEQIRNERVREIFSEPESFVLVTSQWHLDQEKINPSKYKIIKKDRDRVLVVKD